MMRQLIVVFEGHVDHGKSSILDQIRGTSVVASESGGITQKISASIVTLDEIKKICGSLLQSKDITIPGLLTIDTPGHAAFTNLRKRGGNLSDIAVLVIDINEGIKPQTLEAIEILKQYKTPFVIAANKIDLISGFRQNKKFLIENINSQSDYVQLELDKKIYEIVGKLSELNLVSERFDRVEDYTRQIAIVPTSAKTKDGIPELLLVLTGLAQKFLEEDLNVNLDAPAKGTILEVREEKGIGKIIDTIIYEGTLKKYDTIVIGGIQEPIVTRIKALFLQKSRGLPTPVDFGKAACNLIISAPNIDEVHAGMPIIASNQKNIEKIKQEIQKEIQEVIIETQKDGIIVKADSLGSLEALIKLLQEREIPIRFASIGDINKKDLAQALSQKEDIYKVVLGFNVKLLEKTKELKIITHDIIYAILDDYEAFKEKQVKSKESKELQKITRPAKILLMKGYVFRQSNPAVVGVDVVAGTIKQGMPFEKMSKKVTEIKSIQLDGKNIQEAPKGKQVAVSLTNVTVGRQVNSGDILYSHLSEEEYRKLKKLKKLLSGDEIMLLKEIAQYKRSDNPTWGI